MFAKKPTEALFAVRGHFLTTDGSDNIYFYSCDCIDLNRVSLAVISRLSLQCKETFQVWTHSIQLSERYHGVRVMVSHNGYSTYFRVCTAIQFERHVKRKIMHLEIDWILCSVVS